LGLEKDSWATHYNLLIINFKYSRPIRDKPNSCCVSICIFPLYIFELAGSLPGTPALFLKYIGDKRRQTHKKYKLMEDIKMNKDCKFSIRITEADKEALLAIANEKDVSLAQVIREAIKLYLNQ
jgi:hypothetical protein